MGELKKVAAILKINLDEEEDLELCQLLKVLQTHVDEVKDLLVVIGIKQILFNIMQTKQPVKQQTKGDQNGAAYRVKQ